MYNKNNTLLKYLMNINNNKISFITLANGLDPDDYIKEKGKSNFEKLIKTSLSIDEFIWRIYLNDLDRSDPFAITKFEKNTF